MKPLLVQCALSAIKSEKETYFRIKYNRIKKRRGHKKAIIATARMILISIYHMTKTGENFNPYESLKNPKPGNQKITTHQALELLKSMDIDISQINLSSIQQTSSS